jgi:hypothetical protein
MVYGKCNCGKKATSEWLVRDTKMAWTLKFCDKCEPKRPQTKMHKIDGVPNNKRQ